MAEPPFVIRPAVASDYEVLKDIFVRSSLSNSGDRDALLSHPDTLEFVPHATTRVACTPDGRIVGFATGLVNGSVLEVEDLFVDPDWMRRGVGRLLVLDLVDGARERGIRRLEVTGNYDAVAFYERVGFLRCGMVETRFGPAPRLRLDLEG